MTNREFYKEQILDIACAGETFALNKKTHKLVSCRGMSCEDCEFASDLIDCIGNIKEWSNEEYVEHCPFEKDELVEVSDDGIDWHLRYFAYESNDKFPCYVHGKKSTEIRNVSCWKYCRKYGTLGGLIKEQK